MSRSFEVKGVVPNRGSNGAYSYPGEILAGQAAVASAVARLPQDPALTDLPEYLSLATRDGEDWTLGFDDGMLSVFDLSHPGSDLFEQQLAAAEWVDSVERVEREVFAFTLGERLTADVVLAHCVDVCGAVFRRLNP
ncbi:hypothetical protein [Paractinoplanes lichenicola]|uniref:Uncharacterized protein n=1 Tax=Paractinoplanes lichenicola TaxID=2802976 RepID=A0ABS1VDB4_9ACTN|nr:hypothetical protein [Actinoplanes lichenicola]MBL7252698.1 hypothetical protein [Actinoplanes lichenicola]